MQTFLPDAVKEAIETLRSNNVNAFVLDLRDNRWQTCIFLFKLKHKTITQLSQFVWFMQRWSLSRGNRDSQNLVSPIVYAYLPRVLYIIFYYWCVFADVNWFWSSELVLTFLSGQLNTKGGCYINVFVFVKILLFFGMHALQ